MNKLSIKLGIVFFIIIFGLETFMFFFLHTALVSSRVEEELNALHARGNSHTAILEKHFDEDTINHVTLMESESDTDVVITDNEKTILSTSSNNPSLSKYIKSTKLPLKSTIVEDDWKNEQYIATVSMVEKGGTNIGYVFMFQDTQSVHAMIKRLNEHFIIAGLISIVLTIVIIFFLSKALTKPLILMKEATAKISKGNFSVEFPYIGKDELGDLANSIEVLAKDLGYLKEERNDFLASISHELRTPLTYIQGYANILNKRQLTSEEQQNYTSIILEETRRLSDLIKDLFELAKIDKNTFEIDPKRMNLHDFLMKLEHKLSPAFKERKMKLHINCPTHIYLMADSLKFEQVIFNLLDNAMKYSFDGGITRVNVSVRKKEIRLSIIDDGKGIPEKDLPYIFNRFYRVDKSRTRSLGGTGLGLAIVKELVHAHGGSISVTSTDDVGSEFILTFKEAE